jgi:hypothetical protein
VATPSEKGNALEAAVASIERQILANSPALKEKRFLIESKKIITVEGVHHEIDIFVTIDLGDGYKSVFIFECKNWQEAVGKNEVIIFTEKIAVTQAQRGFFVAKSFTKDAQSQAATDPRVSLLIASEHDPTTAPLPFGFHGAIMTPVNFDATFYVRGGDHSKFEPVNFDTAVAKLRGDVIDLRTYVGQWAEKETGAEVLSFRSERVPEGIYERAAEGRREFVAGEFTLNDRDIECGELHVRYNVTIVRPAVVSYFEVESRGRVFSLAPIQIPSGPQMQMRFVLR